MKSALLVVLLAAAATASVVSNDVPDVEVLPEATDVVELPDAADVDVNEGPEVFVAELLELPDPIEAEEETAKDTRRNLSVGTISGTRVYNTQHKTSGVQGYHVIREITVRTNGKVTAVRVTRIGTTQNATPSIISGGVGKSSVKIRIRSAANRGFNYKVEVYAKK